jgi:hypothetical protein
MAALATSQLVATRAGLGVPDASTFRRGAAQGLRGGRTASAADTLSMRTSARAAPRLQHQQQQQARRGARFPSLVVCASAGMNVVFVGAEMAPWSKTGGLGDVLGGLPPAMAVSARTETCIRWIASSSCSCRVHDACVSSWLVYVTDVCVRACNACRRMGTVSWSSLPATTSTRTPGTPASCPRYGHRDQIQITHHSHTHRHMNLSLL